MIIIVGLGNPGKKFQKTRHNIGFRAVDEFAKRNNFPDFKISKKFLAEVSEGILNNKKILLAKPQTFMNLSGKSVRLLINFYKITPPGLVVIHDDMDIPLGKIRIVKNRGAAGHKGAESIIKELKAKNFIRFRIGIRPVKNKQLTVSNIERFVLQKFNKEEEKIVKEVIKKTAEAVVTIINEGLQKAMNTYNK